MWSCDSLGCDKKHNKHEWLQNWILGNSKLLEVLITSFGMMCSIKSVANNREIKFEFLPNFFRIIFNRTQILPPNIPK